MIERIADRKFDLVSPYQPAGDQPQAIETLVDKGLLKRDKKDTDSCWVQLGLVRPLR